MHLRSRLCCRTRPVPLLILAGLAVLAGSTGVRADEGMWTFDNLPIRQLKERYGFEPTPEWIARVRSGAVRFNSGGSGSFVSSEGLVMTNHHIAADTLQKISTAAKDYFKDGFLARTRDEEVKSPDLELNVLVGIVDVTDRVNAAVAKGMDDAAAAKARRQAMAEIEKESFDRTGLRSDVVTLYRGGRYHLYTYKKYTDVRLVFAPEHAIAFFGGDPDNFEFPRYDLDVAFFRAYEDGKPAKPAHYLQWGDRGTKEKDLVFVAGNPGSTSRLNTVAHLEYLRDVSLPMTLAMLQDREEFLLSYGRGGAEASRQASRICTASRTAARPSSADSPACAIRADRGQGEGRAGDPGGSRPPDPERDLWIRLGQDRPLVRRRQADRPARAVPRGGCGFQLRSVPHRPDDRPARGGRHEAQRRAAPRVRRCRPRLARRALYSPAPIYPEFEEAKLADRWRTGGGRRARPTRQSSASSTTGRPRRRPAIWCAARSWPTSQSARGWSGRSGGGRGLR